MESRDVDVELGMSRIAARLERAGATSDLEELADDLLTAAGADRAADDVALLLVRLSPAATQLRKTQLLLSGLADVALARRAVAAVADAVQPQRSSAVVQVASELAANAVEHAGPPVEFRAFATAHRVVVETTDRSALPPVRRRSGRDDERAGGWRSSARSPTPGASGSGSAARPPGPSSAPDPESAAASRTARGLPFSAAESRRPLPSHRAARLPFSAAERRRWGGREAEIDVQSRGGSTSRSTKERRRP